MVSGGKPLVLITGAAGNLGRSIAGVLADSYEIVGLDIKGETDFPLYEVDLTSGDSIREALAKISERFGWRIASVIHLAAYFDFTGEDHPLYRKLNVEGTRQLIQALRDFEVEQFVHASTMLVHAPGRPGERIDEDWPIDPRWAYPRSKAEAEGAIREEAAGIPYVILRLAGVYDEAGAVPTLSQQIARIYERDFESYFYSGSTDVGQSMLHREDMLDAFRRTVDRRAELPARTDLLIGEPEAVGYDALQDEIGALIHGREDWPTIRLPKSIAAAGAWAQEKLEPVVPDAIDKGEPPFVKPFMVRMADDHYALDVSRARQLLDWVPGHRLETSLPGLVESLKRDPVGWYKRNGVTPPEWLEEAAELGFHPGELRERHERRQRAEHRDWRWAHFLNIAFGTWLLTQPPLVGIENAWLARTEVLLGAALMVFAGLSLSWRLLWARWICAGIGILVMGLPFVFWSESAADYLSSTLVGMLVFAFAFAGKPDPGVSPIAALSGPERPPGWSYNPSSWSQRLPIIALALVGLYVSRYLAAYQLDYVGGVWDPAFAGDPVDPQNGTEEIITSHVSEAFPVSDAALGGYVYALEIVTGAIGSTRRWRTMPWLVILFGILIAPLGIVSILFIIIQPIVIGTWSLIALIGAAAILIQIPYSLDELLASLQFIRRRVQAGQNGLRVLFTGDTDRRSAGDEDGADEFDAPARDVLREMVAGGVNLPWNLGLGVLVGLWLLFTRVTLGADGAMANADHLIGSLVLTVISVAAAEVARPVRFLLIPLGLVLLATPFIYDTGQSAMLASLACGALLIVLAFRRGTVRGRYGRWDRLIV
ncbi:NAD-dependent epimerase/dehydratase family protein [Sphingosinicella sp. CPCC 101087]|uniref:NAD-dependent epimerase/dehydratase family protein n=1 Tax=Sphingosinicella sp. CPCC 101087 TaxID=2497754 RepID=UPI00197EE488|nr:NAD-dependent epimerase/dehydratase family protein [Sphingosinicella sp. CPCC 101087]